MENRRHGTLIDALRSIDLFAGISDQALQSLAGKVHRHPYEADACLFSMNEAGDELYIIVSGRVRIQRATTGGRIVHLGLRGPGEHIGEMSLLDGQPRMADAYTDTPCDLLILDRSSFLNCLKSFPEVTLSVMTCLAQRLREAGDRLESRHELDVTGRVAECLLMLADIEGRRQRDGTIVLAQPRTHQELADMIGSVRESVTHALRDLRVLRLVGGAARAPLVILNESRLRARCAR